MRRLCIVLSLVLSASAGPALAGIVVSPLKQEITVKPGQTETFNIGLVYTARRDTDRPQKIHLEVMDFTVSEDGALVFLDRGKGPAQTSASRWITLAKTDLTLAPGKGERVEGTVTAPMSAGGEYYACVMVSLGGARPTASGVGINYRIATGLFVTVAGRTLTRRAQVVRTELTWPTTQPASTRPDAARDALPRIVSLLHNAGQGRFEATGRVRISEPAGRVLCDWPLMTRRALVQAGDTRRFECPISWPLPPGNYDVRVEYDYQSKWARATEKSLLTVTPEQSHELRRRVTRSLAERGPGSIRAVQAATPRLSAVVPAGGLRALKVDLKNTSDLPIDCFLSLVAPLEGSSAVGMIDLTPDRFTMDPKTVKTISLAAQMPQDVAGGCQATLVVESTGSDVVRDRLELPVELTTGKNP